MGLRGLAAAELTGDMDCETLERGGEVPFYFAQTTATGTNS
jgi:hypothetical protein